MKFYKSHCETLVLFLLNTTLSVIVQFNNTKKAFSISN